MNQKINAKRPIAKLSNDHGKIDQTNEISYFESSDDSILSEFTQAQGSLHGRARHGLIEILSPR